jgi:ribosomal protein RSM22 (predicted rRNA methylase)
MWTHFPRTVILPVSGGPSTGYLLSRTVLDSPWVTGHFPENQDQGMIDKSTALSKVESTALSKVDCRIG